MSKESREPHPIERRTVRVKPHVYQPSKAELEEPLRIDATPEEAARAMFCAVKPPDPMLRRPSRKPPASSTS